MARKDELASRLGSGSQPRRRPSWQDTISMPAAPPDADVSEEEPVETPKPRKPRKVKAKKAAMVRKTYILTPELVNRVATTAGRERVKINDLVRFLLISSLDMLDSGELELPTKPAMREINFEEF